VRLPRLSGNTLGDPATFRVAFCGDKEQDVANCAQCNTDILFGGVKAEGVRFCKQSCHEQYMQLRRTSDAYQASLGQLRQNPSDPVLKRNALAAGRAFASATRQGRGVTVFDEVALSNDIQAACAAAQPHAFAQPSTLTLEQRLLRLEELRSKSLITQEEFDSKRSQILAEL